MQKNHLCFLSGEKKKLLDRPKSIYVLAFLWALLGGMFIVWGAYSLNILLDIPNWDIFQDFETLRSIINFGYTMSTILWFVFSSIFVVIAYGVLKADSWVWTTSLIISTIFLAIFSLMLASFIINTIIFLESAPNFSVLGLISTIINFIIDLGIIFFLTRPKTKLYFKLSMS